MKLDNNWYGGIDPGKNGAACLKSEENIMIFDYKDLAHTAAMLKKWKEQYNIKGVFLELVSNHPDDGGSSAFRFGTNYGIWQGGLAALDIPFKLIPIRTWRKGLFKKTDGETTKKKSLAVARRMFPESEYFFREKDHDRAEAMLMAFQAERFWNI